MTRRLRAGTRGSALALRQTELVIAALRDAEPGVDIEQVTVHTEGDRRRDLSLGQLGGQGVFVKDIEARLLGGEIDFAVHSLKDMPAELPASLTIGAVPPRADARDALAGRDGATLAQLPPGARVGTDSRRRAVQLLALRPDLTIESIRGNVDTRLRKVSDGNYDAAVLAFAGLERLGLGEHATQVFSLDEVLPAIGQGVLAVECRADDAELLALLQCIDDPDTHVTMTAERAFLRRLGAGCRLPVGAYAALEQGHLRLRGLVAGDDGAVQCDELSGPPENAEALGVALAEQLAARAGLTLETGAGR